MKEYIKKQSVKWFKRMLAIGTALIILSMFSFGLAFIFSAIVNGGFWNIVLLILGIVMLYYSGKVIDITIKELMEERKR